jgi:uroporphyrinogen-III decarboxylase
LIFSLFNTAQIQGPLILNVCGDCMDRLDLFADAGFDAYHFEWQVDAKMAVENLKAIVWPSGKGCILCSILRLIPG